jgi:hypothetical protein
MRSIRNGMTVEAAYKLGMRPDNLRRDVERGCIKVGG